MTSICDKKKLAEVGLIHAEQIFFSLFWENTIDTAED